VWSQADIDALKAAVSTGILTVSYDGPPKRMVTYQSLSAMRALLASMVQDVAKQNGDVPYRFATTSKGV
jgi:enoyl-[acyl-carrier-protein] reductase (NADH)